MITVEIASENNTIDRCGILMIFSLNDQSYAAAIPLRDNDTPLAVDIRLFACEIREDESFDLFLIDDKDEYNAASKAFSTLTDCL